MPVLRHRRRQIAFRVSENEYATICELCGVVGARSVSDYVRSIVCRVPMLTGDDNRDALADRILELDQRVQQLDEKLQQLSGYIGALRRDQ